MLQRLVRKTLVFIFLPQKYDKIVHFQTKEHDAVEKPNGVDLLKTLIELLADQEGVKVNYKIEKKENDDG